jgi:excisionase family DNA binding protein
MKGVNFMSNQNTIQVTMNAKDAAAYLGISYWLILEMAKRHDIPFVACGSRKLFRKEALDKWMSQQEESSLTLGTEDEQYGMLRKIN